MIDLDVLELPDWVTAQASRTPMAKHSRATIAEELTTELVGLAIFFKEIVGLQAAWSRRPVSVVLQLVGQFRFGFEVGGFGCGDGLGLVLASLVRRAPFNVHRP